MNYEKVSVISVRIPYSLIKAFLKTSGMNLDAQAGIMGDKLSGGQKQMIHILRAICKDNKIVIMDEPTSSIDTTNKEQILNALKELSKNSTMILITHESLGLTSNSVKI